MYTNNTTMITLPSLEPLEDIRLPLEAMLLEQTFWFPLKKIQNTLNYVKNAQISSSGLILVQTIIKLTWFYEHYFYISAAPIISDTFFGQMMNLTDLRVTKNLGFSALLFDHLFSFF